VSIAALRKLRDEGATVHDLGVCILALGSGAFQYRGHLFRVLDPKRGECAALLGGENCRLWGATSGRLEIAHGTPDTSRYDPAPGLYAPWSQVCLFVEVTNGWKPDCAAEIAEALS
jgi:hypothetical protein